MHWSVLVSAFCWKRLSLVSQLDGQTQPRFQFAWTNKKHKTYVAWIAFCLLPKNSIFKTPHQFCSQVRSSAIRIRARRARWFSLANYFLDPTWYLRYLWPNLCHGFAEIGSPAIFFLLHDRRQNTCVGVGHVQKKGGIRRVPFITWDFSYFPFLTSRATPTLLAATCSPTWLVLRLVPWKKGHQHFSWSSFDESLDQNQNNFL